MVTDVTPVTFQLRVELPPALMLGGLVVKELITGKEGVGGGAAATVTVTGWVTLPAALVALKVIGSGAAVTAIVTDLVTLPAALIAVRV
jgi:hypothetical protein